MTFLCTCQIQLLHCLKQSPDGGENVLVDALHASRILREENPEHYQTLTTVKVLHEDINSHPDEKQFYMAGANPVIRLVN